MPNTLFDFRQHLHQLRHQSVRDLAWCCFSAPLLQELRGSDSVHLPISDASLWPWLTALDQQPDALLDTIATVKSTRLGIYYETLWRFYFSQRSEWELLHHNLPVNRGGNTLGAFDFLCRRGDEYWHIETAVKFYLCNGKDQQAAREWHHWIGPNSSDRLDIKLARLRDHQLPLHHTTEAKSLMQQLHPDVKEWKTGLCLQGYLFSPDANHSGPAFSTENYGRGEWWYLPDFLQYLGRNPDTQWMILERLRWLSPAHSDAQNELLDSVSLIDQLQRNVGEQRRPLLVAAMKKSAPQTRAWNDTSNATDCGQAAYWQEHQRGFVVPVDWPHHQPAR